MGSNGTEALQRFIQYIIDPFLLLVFAAGLFLFMYGFVQFMIKLTSGGDTGDGKRHMIGGVIGMFIMVSFYGILSILSNTFGLGIDPKNPGSYNPNVSNLSIPAPANFFQ